jgi:hypothetical protein
MMLIVASLKAVVNCDRNLFIVEATGDRDIEPFTFVKITVV